MRKCRVIKKRELSIDFVRALCAIGIIVYHFYCHTDSHLTKYFYLFANGDFGSVIVNVFFLISGAMLYYNNPEISSLKYFYYKRFRSIFPMFYISFTGLFVITVIRSHNFFYGGNPIKLLLTLFGVDGYFLYLGSNYYQVGEWFLGAIIMLYFLYPLLLKLFNKSSTLVTILVFSLYATVFIPGIYKIDIGRNLFSCLISFELGMVLTKNSRLWKKNCWLFLLSILVAVVLLSIRLNYIHENISVHLLSICFFIILSYIGSFLMKSRICLKVFSEISSVSFAIFLLQHVVILCMLRLYMPANDMIAFLWLLAIIILTIVLAKVLTLINTSLLNSKLFRRIDRLLKSNHC